MDEWINKAALETMVISIPIVINIQYSNTDSLRMSEPASCFPKHLTDPEIVHKLLCLG